MKTYAIIPAGGTSSRLGGNLPKQYHLVHGKQLIAYTLEVFQTSSLIDEIVISAQPDFFPLLNEVRSKYSIHKLRPIVQGGKERQDSVYNALISLKDIAGDDDLIAVHDAARPLLQNSQLEDVINDARHSGAALLALKARDTLLRGDGFVDSYVDRSEFYYAQTPQVFRYSILKEAMEAARAEGFYGTDESMLVKRIGHAVKITHGSPLNFKVTTQDDMDMVGKLV